MQLGQYARAVSMHRDVVYVTYITMIPRRRSPRLSSPRSPKKPRAESAQGDDASAQGVAGAEERVVPLLVRKIQDLSIRLSAAHSMLDLAGRERRSLVFAMARMQALHADEVDRLARRPGAPAQNA
jgi:hypothetical protein